MAAESNVQYQWKDDAKFELSGREFEFLINSIRMALSTPEAQQVLTLAQANGLLENLLAKGIESGDVFKADVKEEDDQPQMEVVK